MKESQRSVLRNMSVLVIAPFASFEVDMARTLEDEALELGLGKLIRLSTGQEIRLVMFPMAFTGDTEGG